MTKLRSSGIILSCLRLCGCIVMIAASGNVWGQQVVSSAGTMHQNENLSISWTLGETVIQTFEGQDYILTQGFHQSNLTVVAVEELAETLYTIEVYPNPTRDHVTLSVDQLNAGSIQYYIFDINANMVASERLTDASTRISFEDFSPGTYFIRVHKNNKPLKTFKIIKTH